MKTALAAVAATAALVTPAHADVLPAISAQCTYSRLAGGGVLIAGTAVTAVPAWETTISCTLHTPSGAVDATATTPGMVSVAAAERTALVPVVLCTSAWARLLDGSVVSTGSQCG